MISNQRLIVSVRRLAFSGAAFVAALTLLSCSQADSKSVARGQTQSPSDKNKSDDPTQKKDGTQDATKDPDNGTSTADAEAKGRQFFADNVEPKFHEKCESCHADPRIPVIGDRGPLSIFSYEAMKAKLTDGTSSQANALIDKMRGVVTHGGANQCAGGDFAVEPCSTVVEWWGIEFGKDDSQGGGDGSGKPGLVSNISSIGIVLGWAVDPADTSKTVDVKLYGDGDESTGTLVTTAKASASGADGGNPGSHAFRVDLPAEWKDGKEHQLTVYAVLASGDVQIADMKYTAYAPSDAGRTFFNNTVLPKMGTCKSCHGVAYDTQFYSLLSSSPAKGGTATNNELINKPSMSNGVNHAGGRRCASQDASPCAEFQQWWKIEFGGG